MKIVVLTGSPHKNGTSALLAERFIAGAQEAGNTVFRFDAAFEELHPCLGCDACGYGNAPCVFRDAMDELNPKLLEADMVVFISPLYYFGLSAQLKMVIDRFYANDIRLNGRKRSMLMVTAYNPRPWVMEGVKAHYATLLRYLNWKDAGQLFALGCNVRSQIERSDYPQQAYEMGRSLSP